MGHPPVLPVLPSASETPNSWNPESYVGSTFEYSCHPSVAHNTDLLWTRPNRNGTGTCHLLCKLLHSSLLASAQTRTQSRMCSFSPHVHTQQCTLKTSPPKRWSRVTQYQQENKEKRDNAQKFNGIPQFVERSERDSSFRSWQLAQHNQKH